MKEKTPKNPRTIAFLLYIERKLFVAAQQLAEVSTTLIFSAAWLHSYCNRNHLLWHDHDCEIHDS